METLNGLIVGSYVYYKGDICQISCISEQFCDLFSSSYLVQNVPCGEISPIPIASSILTRLGFSQAPLPNPNIFEHDLYISDSSINLWGQQDISLWVLTIHTNHIRTKTSIEYVHQLQAALAIRDEYAILNYRNK